MKEVPGCVSLASFREGQRSSVRRQDVTGRALAAVFLGRFTVGTWRNDGPARVSVSAWQRCWSWFARAVLACRWLSEWFSSGKQTPFCRSRWDGETRCSSASVLPRQCLWRVVRDSKTRSSSASVSLRQRPRYIALDAKTRWLSASVLHRQRPHRLALDGETGWSTASSSCYLFVGLVTQCGAMADAAHCDGQRSVLRCLVQRSALHDAPYCMFLGFAIRFLSCSSLFSEQPSWAVCFETFRNLLRWIPFTLSFASVLHFGKVCDARVVA